MKSSASEIQPIIGTSMAGGFYAGRIVIEGKHYALIVAPKAEGEHAPIRMFNDSKDVPAAASWNDGLSNTNALAEAGSILAQWVRGLRIGGFDDWYLPSVDELEILYRNLKPTSDENYVYNRSGLNLSALEPTRPYTPTDPSQTQAELFKAGGAEAFDDRWYWSSTKHASDSDFAWGQYFGSGGQSYVSVGSSDRARAVRRLPI
jgi:hypothetical protein